MDPIVANELTVLFECFTTSHAFVAEISSIDKFLVCLVLKRCVYLQMKFLVFFKQRTVRKLLPTNSANVFTLRN